ncbi:MAG: SIS domain-containing protein [Micropruina sp.]|nr:SIS domain-containing protein [Micropruina sp.]
MPDTLTLKPIDPEILSRGADTVGLRPAVDSYVEELVKQGLRNVYFVGAGGSLICSYPAHYLLQRSTELPVYQLQSDELNCQPPAAMGPGSLVVLASYTGTTKETVAAARTAKATGATVVAAAKDGSPLAEAADRSFPGKSDLFELILAYALLKATGKLADPAAVDASLEALPAALTAAVEQADAQLADVAAACKDEPVTYVLGSGPNQAWAYGFAMCYLQEMQWKHAAGYNAGEFFQGAFEVVDDGVPVILWLAEDASRPMAERAKSFLQTYCAKAHYVDTVGLDLPGVADELRPDLTPLLVGVLASRLAQHYEALRNHDLEQRHYMFKVEY